MSVIDVFVFSKIAVRNCRKVSNKRQETRLINVTDKKTEYFLARVTNSFEFFEIESILVMKNFKQLYLFQSLNQLMLNLTED